MPQQLRETVLKQKKLRDMGFVILSKWSCHFAKEIKEQGISEDANSLGIEIPTTLGILIFGYS